MKLNIAYNSPLLNTSIFIAITKNHALYTTSTEFAKTINKPHDDVIIDIQNAISRAEFYGYNVKMFYMEDVYADDSNVSRRMYKISREGIEILISSYYGDDNMFKLMLRHATSFYNANNTLRNIINWITQMPEEGSAEYFAKALQLACEKIDILNTEIQKLQEVNSENTSAAVKGIPVDNVNPAIMIDATGNNNDVEVFTNIISDSELEDFNADKENLNVNQESFKFDPKDGVDVKDLAEIVFKKALSAGYNIQIGSIIMHTWLRMKGYTTKKGKTVVPIDKYVVEGYFKMAVKPYQRNTSVKQMAVTPKGQGYFADLIISDLERGIDVIKEVEDYRKERKEKKLKKQDEKNSYNARYVDTGSGMDS